MCCWRLCPSMSSTGRAADSDDHACCSVMAQRVAGVHHLADPPAGGLAAARWAINMRGSFCSDEVMHEAVLWLQVDTHVHHSACMHQKHLLRFIKSKLRKEPHEVVIFRDGKYLTLQEVFESLSLTGCDPDTPAHRKTVLSLCSLLHVCVTVDFIG